MDRLTAEKAASAVPVDAAHLFRLALERASAGTVLHGVGEEGVPVRDIAGVIGRQLDSWTGG